MESFFKELKCFNTLAEIHKETKIGFLKFPTLLTLFLWVLLVMEEDQGILMEILVETVF